MAIRDIKNNMENKIVCQVQTLHIILWSKAQKRAENIQEGIKQGTAPGLSNTSHPTHTAQQPPW
jgi:hypothetical protein